MNDGDTIMNITNSGITAPKRLIIFTPFNLIPLPSGKQLFTYHLPMSRK